MPTLKDTLRKILPKETILWTHKIRAIAATIFYGIPSRKLKVIGVTGTNGKTTVCNLVAEILEGAGHKVGLSTTINYKIGKNNWVNKSKMTTSGPFQLQKLLSDMVKEKCDYAVIETTSHAIKQYRNWGIKYDVAVLTNITHDHLDYHENFADYRDTKLKLFMNHPKASIINRDDNSYIAFAKCPADKIYLYSIKEKADITARKIFLNPKGSTFNLITHDGQITINLKLPGEFNIYNALAAAGVGLSQDINLETIKASLEKIKGIPGRMEQIECGQDFTVIIDFAHTPDGLQKVFETVKNFAKGKIIHVGGATGNRDRTKRPILGAISGKYSDITIVTNEDPYTEDPWKIIEEVSQGVPRGANKENKKNPGKNFFKISDRVEAIKMALSLAKKDDVVLITGKGAEEVMAVGNKLVPYSDKKVVEKLLSK
jgi:UDP-N-acetylmuramoyl-L-alanyl-D-glutamate--2,6-diaminopimelate ligase